MKALTRCLVMTISPSFGAITRGNRSERLLKEFLMLCRGFNGTEEHVSGTNLRQSGAKADLDVDNRHAGGTRVIEDACGTSQEGVFVILRMDGNDAGLTVHAQDGGAGRIDRKCSSHDTPCDRGVPVRFYLNLPPLTFDSCLERDRGDGCPSCRITGKRQVIPR